MESFKTMVNLLVCQKSKIKDWKEHFEKYYFIQVYDLTKPKELSEFEGVMVGGKHRVIGIINYELAFRRIQLLSLHDFTLMLDESSLIQNESAKRTKFIMQLQPKNLILLSGTPTGGKYENLYSQLHLLGWEISKDLYWKQYVETEWVETSDGYFRKDVIGYKNVDRLKDKLAAHGAVFMKTTDAGITLPPMNKIQLKVPVSKEYKKFRKTKLIEIEGKELVGDSVLTDMLYQRMLCGQYNQDKLEAFKDLAESTEERLLVFYNFNDELEKLKTIAEELEKPISIVNGEIKDTKNFEKFSNAILFGQYQASSMGLNLQACWQTVYFTLPLSSELFEQSHARTNRIGQNQPCFYYYLMCEGSIEEHILDTLNLRKDYTDELFKRYNQKNDKKTKK